MNPGWPDPDQGAVAISLGGRALAWDSFGGQPAAARALARDQIGLAAAGDRGHRWIVPPTYSYGI